MRSGLESTSGRNYGAWVQSPNWSYGPGGQSRERTIYYTRPVISNGLVTGRTTTYERWRQ